MMENKYWKVKTKNKRRGVANLPQWRGSSPKLASSMVGVVLPSLVTIEIIPMSSILLGERIDRPMLSSGFLCKLLKILGQGVKNRGVCWRPQGKCPPTDAKHNQSHGPSHRLWSGTPNSLVDNHLS